MGGGILRIDDGRPIVGIDSLARPAFTHQGPAEDQWKFVRLWMQRDRLGKHIDRLGVAANLAQRFGEPDGRCQRRRILAVLGRPEIRTGQRVGAVHLGNFLWRGRGELFSHRGLHRGIGFGLLAGRSDRARGGQRQ